MNPPAKTGEARALVDQGLAHHRAGRIEDAERLYREALARAPLHPDALHYLGLVLHRKGKFQDAAETLALAAAPLAGDPDFHANFGLALKDSGRWNQAKEELRRALAARPHHSGALFNLGLLLGEEGDWDGSAALFGRLAAREPASAEARYFRGRALKELGRLDEARAALREAVRLEPGFDLAWIRLAELALAENDLEAALAAAKKATEAAPANLEAAVLTAEIHARRGDAEARDSWLARARAIETEPARVFFVLAIELRNRGLAEPARRALRRCLMFEPDHPKALWSLARILPETYVDEAEIARARQGYVEGLGAIEAGLRLETAAGARDAFYGLSVMTNFFLAYQEKDDRDLQIRFGKIVRRVVTARFPEFAKPPAPGPAARAAKMNNRAQDSPPGLENSAPSRPAEPDGRLRVGFLSAYFRLHVVPRLCAGWIEKLDRRRFKVFGYHTGPENDNITRLIARQCEVFRHLPPPSAGARDPLEAHDARFADLARAVAGDRLDALIFTDIGMDMTTFALAALRLAPVQATGIGHPVTTGLPTVDYFLSGELIEAENGEDHYSEKLVRLPNVSVRLFDPHLAVGRKPRSRASFGFGEGEVVFLCSQSVFKYLPHYDRIYPAIAKAVPDARLVFIRSMPPEKEATFLVRLARAFAAEGLDRDRRCVFLDRLSPHDFVALHHVGDVFLDTPGWSGGNTTHEAIAAGLPIVTLPGEFMRGRVTHGMLRMIGVTETVAKDVDDYIAIAVRLGREPGFRARMRAQIEANRGKLYNDETCVRSLEEFIVRAVAAANPAAR
ncbi:MAG: tetratricopeptide repeat protein [Rhodospirillales bacterium]|nr:tetratricopeptide repeat protein [Rhodospirillales bacterium]